MVTKADCEKPPRIVWSRRLILVVAAVIAAVALVIAGAWTLARDEPVKPPTETPGIPGSPQIADASFVLQNYGTLTTEATSFWQDLTLDHAVSLGLPLWRYNRYYTRFFLKEGETVEILVESSSPLGASLTGMEGISVMLMPAAAPYESSSALTYLPPTESGNGGYFARLERVGGNWQVKWAITALSSDYYWLILANLARQDAWCHFTVSVPQG